MRSLKTIEIDKNKVIREIQAVLDENESELVGESLEAEVFISHMISFIERYKQREMLDEEKEQYALVMQQIEEQSLYVVDRIVAGLSDISDTEIPFFEKVLIATHVQSYKDRKKGT